MSHRKCRARTLDWFGQLAVATLFGLTFFTVGADRVVAADPTQAAVDDAHAMVTATGANKGNDKLVLGFAYPTAKSLTKIDYLSMTTANDGSFTLTYRYSYRDSDNDPADFQLRYGFSAKGKLTDVRVVAGKHSSFWPPLSTAEITLGVMKEVIRNDEKLKKDPVWKALLTVDSPSEFLAGIMNIKAGK